MHFGAKGICTKHMHKGICAVLKCVTPLSCETTLTSNAHICKLFLEHILHIQWSDASNALMDLN